MPKALDLKGLKFDRLLVCERITRPGVNGYVMWRCACDCGGTKDVASTHLKRGLVRSCGCLRKELMQALGKSSKQENPISRTKEYRIAMRRARRAQPHNVVAERLSRLMAWALRDVGAIKTSPTLEVLGFTAAQLKKHIERQFLPGMSWENRRLWQLDHIIPISQAKTKEDVIRLNQLSNLRPLWAKANNEKRDKIVTLL